MHFLNVKRITFDEITPFWNILWPNMHLERKACSLLFGGYDSTIKTNSNIVPLYFGVEIDGKIVGVNSCNAVNDIQYRSRGLYVLPEYRRRGIAQMLFNAVYEQGKKERRLVLWSMPRKPALSVYLNFGFKVVSDFVKHAYGYNCYVIKAII